MKHLHNVLKNISGIFVALLMISLVCDYDLDDSPLVRSNNYAEERVNPGVYEAIGQRYNSLSGTITAIKFWGRVNPNSGFATNTIKVKVYDENVGLPGVILGQTTIVLDSSSTVQMKTAIFSLPFSVNGNVIIAIEPNSKGTDDFYIRRNVSPDGQGLKLMLLKSGNQWFNNLGPGFNYDYLLIPQTSDSVEANFSSTTNMLAATFNNLSSGTNKFKWFFGDGDSSSLSNPMHTYASQGTYTVLLYALSGDSNCFDTTSKQVTVMISDVDDYADKNDEDLYFRLNQYLIKSSTVEIQIYRNCALRIYSISGKLMYSSEVLNIGQKQLFLPDLNPGIYFIKDYLSGYTLRFIRI